MTHTEEKIISLRAALADREGQLAHTMTWNCATAPDTVWHMHRSALKAQIRDLEFELHALLQELPSC
jgi:hypothetical protein